MPTRIMPLVTLILLSFTSHAIAGQTWYVDVDATGPTHDGTTWCQAFVDLQDALDAATTGDEIRVANGTYKPDRGTADRFSSFQLKSFVRLNGGYAGCGNISPNDRDYVLYETTLSADLLGDDGPDFANNGENSYHVLVAEFTRDAKVDGFTITGGNANGSSDSDTRFGGGLFANANWIDNLGLRVSNCLFINNWAISGGGTWRVQSIIDSKFIGNHPSGVNGFGGPDGIIRRCLFSQNDGVGVYLVGSTVVEDSIFINNKGRGILAFGAQGPIINCLITGNTASRSAAIFAFANGRNLSVLNCTITDNYSENGPAIEQQSTATTISATNCIVWNNRNNMGNGEDAQIDFFNTSFDNSIIQGWSGTAEGINTTGDDPLFVDEINGNYRIQTMSPALDSGDNSFVPIGINNDLDGSARIFDGDGNATSTVDKGAYEWNDCNNNNIVDTIDVSAGGGSSDCNNNSIPDECEPIQNCNSNALIDICDIGSGFSNDCNENGIPDECDISNTTSTDCDNNGIPDDCELDCDANETPDSCQIVANSNLDCNANGVIDTCEIEARVLEDCNTNNIPDICEQDCNGNGFHDMCDIADNTELDCNLNGIPDSCDLDVGSSLDCNTNNIPDDCETDCNSNNIPDECDLSDSTSPDCNLNGIPDECESNQDCNGNNIQDICEIFLGISDDCNLNAIPDQCEPQEDCNTNFVQDICDIAAGTSIDCNFNGIPDSCELSLPSGRLEMQPMLPGSNSATTAGIKIGEFFVIPNGGATLELHLLVSDWSCLNSGELQAVHAKFDGASYSNGIGGDIQPMNFATPDGCPLSGITCSDGAFIVKRIGITSGCNCNDGPCDPIDNGLCKNNPDYVFKNITTIADVTFPGLDYAFENTSIGISVAEPDASGNYIGTILLDIPADAQGLYQISLVNNTADTYLVDGTGATFPIDDLPPTNILVTSAPLDDTRDRYISFDPSIDGATATAFRVTVLGLAGQIADKYVAAQDANGVSQLVDTPVFRDWTESLVYVGGCIIAPGNFYDIAPTTDDLNFGVATIVATTPAPSPRFYGDAVGTFDGNTDTWGGPDGLVTANDILASVKKFQLDPTAPHFTRIDLVPANPNGVINASDVLAFALAFQGVPYPHPAPQDCP